MQSMSEAVTCANCAILGVFVARGRDVRNQGKGQGMIRRKTFGLMGIGLCHTCAGLFVELLVDLFMSGTSPFDAIARYEEISVQASELTAQN